MQKYHICILPKDYIHIHSRKMKNYRYYEKQKDLTTTQKVYKKVKKEREIKSKKRNQADLFRLLECRRDLPWAGGLQTFVG